MTKQYIPRPEDLEKSKVGKAINKVKQTEIIYEESDDDDDDIEYEIIQQKPQKPIQKVEPVIEPVVEPEKTKPKRIYKKKEIKPVHTDEPKIDIDNLKKEYEDKIKKLEQEKSKIADTYNYNNHLQKLGTMSRIMKIKF